MGIREAAAHLDPFTLERVDLINSSLLDLGGKERVRAYIDRVKETAPLVREIYEEVAPEIFQANTRIGGEQCLVQAIMWAAHDLVMGLRTVDDSCKSLIKRLVMKRLLLMQLLPEEIIGLGEINHTPNLSYMNCEGLDFNEIATKKSPLNGYNFMGANLKGANLSGQQLNRAGFIGAKLQNARLGASVLCGADFRNSTLTGANFDRAILSEETTFLNARFNVETFAMMDGPTRARIMSCLGPVNAVKARLGERKARQNQPQVRGL